VSGWLLRRVSACLGALGVLGLAFLPPEHVHRAADHDDHHRAEVVHRHFAPHHAAAPQTHVENPDDDATYLSSVFTVPADASAVGPDNSCLVASQPEDAAPGFTQWHRQARDLRAHDPPWACATGLRGPPQLLA
jgi:hypothetical protein